MTTFTRLAPTVLLAGTVVLASVQAHAQSSGSGAATGAGAGGNASSTVGGGRAQAATAGRTPAAAGLSTPDILNSPSVSTTGTAPGMIGMTGPGDGLSSGNAATVGAPQPSR